MKATDVVVIGAGIIGSAAAYYLAKKGVDVTLIDRGGPLSSGTATPACAGGVRQQGRVPSEIPLALYSIQLWTGLEAELGSLEAGKRAYLVIRDPFAAVAYPGNNVCHLLALTLGAVSVRTVIVDGRVVFDDGHTTQVEERDIYREVSRSVRERARRLGIDPGPEWPVID